MIVDQILFGTQGLMESEKSRMYFALGLWHPYKVACEVLYRMYARSVFAPLIHAIDAMSCIYRKPKLMRIATLMTQVRLAYPAFRDVLLDALNRSDVAGPDRVHLRNIRDLFEYFIPSVR